MTVDDAVLGDSEAVLGRFASVAGLCVGCPCGSGRCRTLSTLAALVFPETGCWPLVRACNGSN